MKRKRVLAVVLILVLFSGYFAKGHDVAYADSPGPVLFTQNGHYYEAVPQGGTWGQAKQWAESRTFRGAKGHLATVTSAEENDFIINNLGVDVVSGGYWLGGFQPPGSPEPDGNWQWVTGEPWVYSNWSVNEPTNCADTYNDAPEEVLHIFNRPGVPPGVWNDLPHFCNAAGYVVEYDLTLNLEILDGHSFVDSSGKDITNNPNELLFKIGESSCLGAVTDGVTKLLLRTSTNEPGTLTFSITKGAKRGDNGLLRTLNGARGEVIKTDTVIKQGDEKAFAIFEAPNHYIGTGSEKEIMLTVKFVSSKTGDTVEIEQPIKLVRPPVILVHGFMSNPADCWEKSNFDSELKKKLPNLRTYLADYEATNISHFNVNAFVVTDEIEKARKELLEDGIAMVQADVIGHSMGGLLARIYVGQGNHFYKNYTNYYEGNVNRIITIDTPHKGSFLAENYKSISFIAGGAAEDLASSSKEILNINRTPTDVPCHTITGKSSIVDLNLLPNIEKILYKHIKLEKPPAFPSDFIVSTESQQGGLEGSATDCYDHAHTGATESPIVVSRVAELLQISPDNDNVFPKGFPLDEPELILIVPGIAGTSLSYKGDDVWLPNFLPGFLEADLSKLMCNPDGSSKYPLDISEPNEIIDKFYGKLLKDLSSDFNIVSYAGYDWRMDIRDNAKVLANKVDEITKKHKIDKVTLIAHSTGGLVSCQYIADGNADKVKKLITLGTPYLGSPKALYAFETGNFMHVPLSPQDSEGYLGYAIDSVGDLYISKYMKILLPNVEELYQLLPSPKYFKYYNKYSYIKERRIYTDGDHIREEISTKTSFGDTIKFLAGRDWSQVSFLKSAESFHNNLDYEVILNKTVDSYLFVGYGQPTLGGMTEDFKYDSRKRQWIFKGISDITSTDGDGTVPLSSAIVGGRIKSDRVIYIYDDHSGLCKNDGVIQQIINILKEKNGVHSIKEEQPSEAITIKLKVGKNTELHIYDENGNHFGPVAGGGFEQSIENASVYVLDDSKIIFLKYGKYTVKVSEQSSVIANLTLELYNSEGELINTRVFKGIKAGKSLSI